MMKINLNQEEILAAIKKSLASNGMDIENREVTATFKAGRKGSGVSVQIIVGDAVYIPGLEADEPGCPVEPKKNSILRVVDTPKEEVKEEDPVDTKEPPALGEAVDSETSETLSDNPALSPDQPDPPKKVSLFSM